MKRVILSLSLISGLVFTSCDNAASKIDGSADSTVSASDVDASGTPAFSFDATEHAFGTIEEGTIAKHDFVFTNTGDAPLIITNAQGSCGCTVPQWPREPIAPGEQGTIHVEFNSNGRQGNQTKQVTLNSNTVPNTKVLKISAQVEPKAAAAVAE